MYSVPIILFTSIMPAFPRTYRSTQIHARAHAHLHGHTQTNALARARAHTHTHTYTQTHTHTHTHTNTHTRTHAHTNTRTDTHANTHTHTRCAFKFTLQSHFKMASSHLRFPYPFHSSSNPGSSALEADPLSTRPTRQSLSKLTGVC